MRFEKLGKSYQIVIQNADDLAEVLKLDESLWAVTSAPITSFKADPALLNHLDTDKTGRIRTDELCLAIKWCLDTLSNTHSMGNGKAEISCSDIRKDSKDGANLLMTAGYVSEQMKSSPESVTLEQVRTSINDLITKPLNGDGVITPDTSPDAAISEYISAAITATGGSPDISGKTGITADQLAQFKTDIADFNAWKAQGVPTNRETMPIGADSHAAWELMQKYAPLIDDFFMLAGFRDFDPENARKFLSADTAAADATAALDFAPLAKPDDKGRLPLSGPAVNPLYQEDIATIREQLFAKVLGAQQDFATAADWVRVKAVLGKYGAYLAAKKGGSVETLPQDKLALWMEPRFADKTAELIAADNEVGRRVAAFSELEKLILFHVHLIRFTNNFVNLRDFYTPDKRAMFERGSAVLDGRWFNFAIETVDPAAHSAVAAASGLFIFYLNIESKDPAKPAYTVAVPATAGTRGNLSVGKRGVFFDLDGVEHDAVITKIIENPISLKEAVLAPFVKVGKLIAAKIEGLSAAAESKILKSAETAMTTPATPPPPPAQPASPATLLMSISISVAALGSAFAMLANSFRNMTPGGRVVALFVIIAIILGPLMIGGIMKLARQDLSYILEGCGWAVNQRMRLTGVLRRQFTERRAYPKNASGTPAKHRRRIFQRTLIVLLAISAALAIASIYMRNQMQAAEAEAKAKPAASVAAPAAEPAPAPAAEEPAPAEDAAPADEAAPAADAAAPAA